VHLRMNRFRKKPPTHGHRGVIFTGHECEPLPDYWRERLTYSKHSMLCNKKDCEQFITALATFATVTDGRLSRTKNRFLCDEHAAEFCRRNNLTWPERSSDMQKPPGAAEANPVDGA